MEGEDKGTSDSDDRDDDDDDAGSQGARDPIPKRPRLSGVAPVGRGGHASIQPAVCVSVCCVMSACVVAFFDVTGHMSYTVQVDAEVIDFIGFRYI